MAEQVVDVISKADWSAAQAEIASLRTRLEAANENKFKEQITALEKTVAAKDEELKNVKTEVDNVKASKKELETTLAANKTEIETLTKKLAEAESKVQQNEKSVVKANRISTLVEKGVSKEEAEKIVASAEAASDELFAVIVETQAKLVELAKAAEKPADDKKKKEKEKEMAKADEKKLEEATTEEEAPLSTDASTDSETDTVIAGLADFLAQEVETRRSKK